MSVRASDLALKLSSLAQLIATLEELGGSKGVARAAGRGLAGLVAEKAVPGVEAAEAARFDRREQAGGGGWVANKTALNKSGELRASMSTWHADGNMLRGTMAVHGKYHHPSDYWPSPRPEGVKEASRAAGLDVLGMTFARAA